MREGTQEGEATHAPKKKDPAQQWLYNLRRMALRIVHHPKEAERQARQIVSEIDGHLKNS